MTVLRDLLHGPSIAVVPGAGTALEARAIERARFAAVYVSGYATAAARHALPDIGLIGGAEMLDAVAAIRAATSLPIVADADTGYGDVLNVRLTVRRLEALGVDGIQIEDQRWPKRCGHLDGKEVVATEVMERKVAAAAATRDHALIIARTDARAVTDLDDAIERCRRYFDAGADAAFVDAPHSVDELREITEAIPDAPLVVNMSETGKTPLLSARELEELGFAMVLFPSSTVRVALRAIEQFLAHLHRTGDARERVGSMASLSELNEVMGLEEQLAFAATYEESGL